MLCCIVCLGTPGLGLAVSIDPSQAVGGPVETPGDGLFGLFEELDGTDAWGAVINLVNFPDPKDVWPYNNDPLDFFVRTGSTAGSLAPNVGVDDVLLEDLIIGDGFLASSERFLATFTGFINIQSPGNYYFWVGHDDGARLYIGDVLAIDDWVLTNFRWSWALVTFSEAGLYPVQVLFFENYQDADLVFAWGGGIDREPVPTDFLFSDFVSATIDIKPGSYPNSINLGSQGKVPVAILSSEDFDAPAEVDPLSIELAGAGVAVRGKAENPMATAEDVNGDGLLDLVLHVATSNLDPGTFMEGAACVTGNTYYGTPIEGWDEITIVPTE